MKTYVKIITVTILSAFAFTAGAQNDRKHSGTPYISKEVVKFSNKNVIEGSRLTVRSIGYPENVISKGVQKLRGKAEVSKDMTNMVSADYSNRIISKEVNRIRG